MIPSINPKVRGLQVQTPQGTSGILARESQYVFNYSASQRECEIALAMPLRVQSYAQNALHPIFAMNLPEGSLHASIRARFAKQFAKLDEMAILSIVGHDQIGRLTLEPLDAQKVSRHPQVGLKELLTSNASDALFEFLLDQYLAAGISGVQPKVLIPDADRESSIKQTLIHSDLIVKMGGPEYPNLTQNEFTCMDAARRAGIPVPDFWLSDDSSLFVIRRFDLDENGGRRGFEDMAVLAGSTYDDKGDYKYHGKYEGIAAIIKAYCGPLAVTESQRFFEHFVLSCMVRNGDGHLKNHGLVYDTPGGDVRLAPLYDVVTTAAYDVENTRTGRIESDRTLALKFNKTNSYPLRKEVVEFGRQCYVRHPEEVIDRIGQAMTESLQANQERFPRTFYERLRTEWDEGRAMLEPPRVFALKPSTPLADDVYEEERSKRLQSLDALRGSAGTAYTFWQHAVSAAGSAGSMDAVVWPKVHLAALQESIAQLGQRPDEAAEALIRHSPGAVTPEGQAAVRTTALSIEAALQKADTPRPVQISPDY